MKRHFYTFYLFYFFLHSGKKSTDASPQMVAGRKGSHKLFIRTALEMIRKATLVNSKPLLLAYH